MMTFCWCSLAVVLVVAFFCDHVSSLQVAAPWIIVGNGRGCFGMVSASSRKPLYASADGDRNDNSKVDKQLMSDGVEEYRNALTKVLSNFMQKESMPEKDPLGYIDFNAPKISPSTSLEDLAAALDYELTEKEWFVTGNVNPIFFSDDFEFQDPDVQLKGIEKYARGVYKLFDQSTSRAEIISTVVNTTSSSPEKPVITSTWRLSGKVNILFGLTIKPYIVYTDFVVDPKTSLIIFQEDRFDLPPWDILLSAFFPFLIGKVTSPPAPPVPARTLEAPKLSKQGKTNLSPLDGLLSMFKR